MALEEPARVEAVELTAGPGGHPPPAEQVAGVGLAICDAVPALEDLLAGVVVAERGARERIAHPLAGGVVAGLGPGGGLAERGEVPRRARGGEVEEEQQHKGKQEEREDEGAPPRPRGRAPRRRRHGREAGEADLVRCVVGLHYTNSSCRGTLLGQTTKKLTSTGP